MILLKKNTLSREVDAMRKEYLLLDRVEGPLIELSNVHRVGYGEVVEVKFEDKEKMFGRVIKIDGDKVVVQVFGSTTGISTQNSSVNFKGKQIGRAHV